MFCLVGALYFHSFFHLFVQSVNQLVSQSPLSLGFRSLFSSLFSYVFLFNFFFFFHYFFILLLFLFLLFFFAVYQRHSYLIRRLEPLLFNSVLTSLPQRLCTTPANPRLVPDTPALQQTLVVAALENVLYNEGYISLRRAGIGSNRVYVSLIRKIHLPNSEHDTN